MPDTEEIDGDVYVSPRYLAGSTYIGDPALESLLALGFDLHNDDLGNAYVTAPDHRIRVGFLPEGDDDGLWRINAYRDRFGPPAWGVSFNDSAPTEFVTASPPLSPRHTPPAPTLTSPSLISRTPSSALSTPSFR